MAKVREKRASEEARRNWLQGIVSKETTPKRGAGTPGSKVSQYWKSEKSAKDESAIELGFDRVKTAKTSADTSREKLNSVEGVIITTDANPQEDSQALVRK